VQIANSLGARVTGVCGAANVEYVRALGADPVIDYRREDWAGRNARYDVIFDAAAMSTFSAARPHLALRGFYINTMPRAATIFAAFAAPLLTRQRCVPFMLKTDATLLARLGALAEQGILLPHIAEMVSLDQVAAAQARMESGRIHGKVCVRIAT
jgi:NADPH:quinone reductase-like Zn-dependent oxidoreductase